MRTPAGSRRRTSTSNSASSKDIFTPSTTSAWSFSRGSSVSGAARGAGGPPHPPRAQEGLLPAVTHVGVVLQEGQQRRGGGPRRRQPPVPPQRGVKPRAEPVQ